MSYLVFARKYRPQTFEEILGQEAIVRTLTNAIREKRIGQAYLFAGPRGTGKTSTARIFAKGLNCQKGPTPAPCAKCQPCQEIAEGRSLDVLEIDGASNRGIDQIRALRELAKFAPVGGSTKVYIIDEVHQITPEGFNALLKTLEEPPPHLLFILATTAAHKVPATILSRCQRFEFRRLSTETIVGKLKALSSREGLKIAEDALLGIARAAGGSLRDAESLLDQVAAYSPGKIAAADVQTLLGTMKEDQFVGAVTAIGERQPVRLLGLVAELADTGVDLNLWGIGLLGFIRHLLVAKAGAGPLGFEDLGQESIERIRQLAEPFSLEELLEMAQALTAALETMRRVGDPRVPLEVALVRLASAGAQVSVSELVDRLERLDRRLREAAPGSGQPPVRASGPAQAPSAQAAPPAAATGAALLGQAAAGPSEQTAEVEEIRAVWDELLREVHEKKPGTAAYLSQGSPLRLEGREGGDPPLVVVGFPKGAEFHCEALSQPQNRDLVQAVLGALLKRPVRCSFEVTEQTQAGTPAASASPAINPSLLNSVLEMFEGKVHPGEG